MNTSKVPGKQVRAHLFRGAHHPLGQAVHVDAALAVLPDVQVGLLWLQEIRDDLRQQDPPTPPPLANRRRCQIRAAEVACDPSLADFCEFLTADSPLLPWLPDGQQHMGQRFANRLSSGVKSKEVTY